MFTTTRRAVLCVALAAVAAFGQGKKTFDAATIKPAAPLDQAKIMQIVQAGGQMPVGQHLYNNRAEYLYLDLKSLIMYAYGVKPYQISGPDWLIQQRFDIQAKYPEGATKDDAPQMLQALLEDRFKLQIHKDKSEHPVLGLIAGKGGTKMTVSAEKPVAIDPNSPLKPGELSMEGPEGKPIRMRVDLTNGSSVVDMGDQGKMSYRANMTANPPVFHIELTGVTMTGFADMMTQLFTQLAGPGGGGRQIVNMTDIAGNYDGGFDLSIADVMAMARNAGVDIPAGAPGAGAAPATGVASDPGGGSSLTDAIQGMGMKLESRKAQIEQLIVDHVEKNPTEN